MVKQVFSVSLLASLMNNLVTHREFTAIYLLLLRIQLASRTFLTVLRGMEAGKIFSKFV